MSTHKRELIVTKDNSPVSIASVTPSPSPTLPMFVKQHELTSYYQRLNQENAQRIVLEKQQAEMADKLAISQLNLAKKTKEWIKLKQQKQLMKKSLSDINDECLRVSELSVHALDEQLARVAASIVELDMKNPQLARTIKSTRKTTKTRVNAEIEAREKVLIQAFERESMEIKRARKTVQKELADEQRLAKKLLSDESALKTQIAATLSREAETISALDIAAAEIDRLQKSQTNSVGCATNDGSAIASSTAAFFQPAAQVLGCKSDIMSSTLGV